MKRHARLAAGVLAASCLPATPLVAAPRVVSLDQCADQFVLALSPREAIAGLSTRARDADSHMRAAAVGLPQRRADAESLLLARPQVAIRWWGGDPRLMRGLERRGVRIVQLEDASDFAGVRRNIRAAAAALDQRARGEALVAAMDGELAASRGAWRGRRALYLTSGGVVAGPGTLMHAILGAAGLADAAPAPGFSDVQAERLILEPPPAIVTGYFDRRSLAGFHWGATVSPPVRRALAGRIIADLPADLVGCPAWFAADAAVRIAARAPGRS
ncbi:MAG TPA: ABC transporter substrate-binding protein [Caulobacteraceae bacterium]|nr:ABC transporter substrate-binding protein [Caulobacteraceae bacterium]